MYTKRTLEDYFLNTSSTLPAVLLAGPRQVGKTTFLKNIASSCRKYVTLDNMADNEFARLDPGGFLSQYSPPILIDEIQCAPQLMPHIMHAINKARRKKPGSCNGMFWMTGSQQLKMIKRAMKILSSHVKVIDMLGFSQSELTGRVSIPFRPDNTHQTTHTCVEISELYRQIWMGSFPGIANAGSRTREKFYLSYVKTYLERDIRDLSGISDLGHFFKFICAVAARTGKLMNYSDIARDADITQSTAKKWMGVFKASGLVMLLDEYSGRMDKIAPQAPKIYMLDTGLCTYLTKWASPQILESGTMSDAIFETWCISEILKSYMNHGKAQADFYYYHDNNQNDIPLVIESEGSLYPVDFKKSAFASPADCGKFAVLEQFKKPVGTGAMVCMTSEVSGIHDNYRSIPAPLL